MLKNIPAWNTLSKYTKPGLTTSFFEMAIKNVFTGDNLFGDKFSIYGHNFSNFLFSNFSIPDITVDNADKIVTVYPSWIYE